MWFLIIHNPHAEFLLSVPTILRFASLEGGNVPHKSLKEGSIELEIDTSTWPLRVPQATESIGEGGLDLLAERIIPDYWKEIGLEQGGQLVESKDFSAKK